MLSDIFGQPYKFWKKSQKKIVLTTSWGLPELTSQGRPLNVRSGRPLDVILRLPHEVSWDFLQDVSDLTSPGWSNGIFRERPGDVGGGRPRDVTGTNICQLGYVYYSQKWLHIEETLMKLNTYLFNKRWRIIKKMQWNLRKKLEIVSKKNLAVNQYTMKISKS